MYMVALLVLGVHLSSIRNPSENQMVKTIKYEDDNQYLQLTDVCPMTTLGPASTEYATFHQSHL